MDISLQYLPFLILCFFGITLSLAFLCIAKFLGPKRASAVKKMPFESGLESKGLSKKNSINVNYHLVAMLFLAFDVEIIFLYPWASNFRGLGWYGFFAVLIFLNILIFGLVYEWKKGGLEWD
jgi:NADH-quinone oxidoreductase subunit A